MVETTKYNFMISSFACDFYLAQEDCNKLRELQRMIDEKDEKLIKDIELLSELEFNLRHGKVKIVEV
ncbi:MAG: hypothetical protein IJO49_04880 [Clostridia bacterium]|nr:hypothetical protein [Clostridia bacterium]